MTHPVPSGAARRTVPSGTCGEPGSKRAVTAYGTSASHQGRVRRAGPKREGRSHGPGTAARARTSVSCGRPTEEPGRRRPSRARRRLSPARCARDVSATDPPDELVRRLVPRFPPPTDADRSPYDRSAHPASAQSDGAAGRSSSVPTRWLKEFVNRLRATTAASLQVGRGTTEPGCRPRRVHSLGCLASSPSPIGGSRPSPLQHVVPRSRACLPPAAPAGSTSSADAGSPELCGSARTRPSRCAVLPEQWSPASRCVHDVRRPADAAQRLRSRSVLRRSSWSADRS